MPEAQADTLASLVKAWWLVAAAAACLPVSVIVFWRVGRWWVSSRPVPLPIDRAWPAVRWPDWYGLGLFILMQALVFGVAALYQAASLANLLPWEPLDIPAMFSPGVFLALIVPPLIGLAFVASFGRGAVATVGVRLGSLWTGLRHGVVTFVAILPVCLAALVVNAFIMHLLKVQVAPHPLLQTIQEGPKPWTFVVAALQAAVLAAVAEEFMYRGVLLMTLLKRIGVIGALVTSSVLFAVLHMPTQPQAVLPMFLLGMAMGYAAYRTRSLVAPITIHALFNALMVSGTFLGTS